MTENGRIPRNGPTGNVLRDPRAKEKVLSSLHCTLPPRHEAGVGASQGTSAQRVKHTEAGPPLWSSPMPLCQLRPFLLPGEQPSAFARGREAGVGSAHVLLETVHHVHS